MKFFDEIKSWFTGSRTVFALVGRSGSGKSYRAHTVAFKHRIGLIVDDGLLIKGDRILAGKSAKQEPNFMAAVKCAVFTDQDHLQSVLDALSKDRSRRILIIGTSDKMVRKISQRLELPQPSHIIRIEDISTPRDIEKAMRTRYTEGKHVIPVSPMQITRKYSNIAYGFLKTTLNKTVVMEKTLVTPEFSKPDQAGITELEMRQMVKQCLFEHENIFRVEEVTFTCSDKGYDIKVKLRTPNMLPIQKQTDLQQYIKDSLEKYGNILVNELQVKLSVWAS